MAKNASLKVDIQNKRANPDTDRKDFYIIGIGGSAGALAAFSELLRNTPVDIGTAFVVIQHLLPHTKSNLSEILSRRVRLPVTEVADGISIEPNRIYVIPPDKCMVVDDNVLKLSPRKEDGLNLPIDAFLISLAEYKKHNAIGVILSGTGSDGTLGLKAIKEAGGITFAQDNTSEFSNMPDSAKEAGIVDYVLNPTDITKKLVSIAQGSTAKNSESNRENKDTSSNKKDNALLEEEDKNLEKILALLRGFSNVDFTYYKPATIKRRITRRMLLNDIKDYGQYADYLQKNSKEIESLYQDILIKVTDFFRDEKVFELLRRKILPPLVKSRPSAIRVWVPGCATGEEVYSLAICLTELLEEHKKNIPIQIFGTDLSENALNTARHGIYPKNIEGSVPEKLLNKYFAKVNGKYLINKSIRAACVFARHNMVADIPFSRLDMISCRNVLIYLDSFLQKKAFPIFHYALNPNGILLLGTAETAGNFQDLFKTINQKHKIYAKKSTSHHAGLELLTRPNPRMPKVSESMADKGHKNKNIDIEKQADTIVLSKHAPAGLIVNSDLAIIQFRGNVSPYLQPASGRATLDLIKMANKSLLPKILEIFAEVKKSKAAVKDMHHGMKVEIEIIPLGDHASEEKYFLILFREKGFSSKTNDAKSRKNKDGDSLEESLELQKELTSTVEQLQALIEARDASSEELKAAHEEVMSTNEELQSTNEELETTKEELQSTNEELMTLNTELQHRNADLERHEQELYRKDEFLSFLGHELRNPLSPIIHSLELAELHGVKDPEIKQLFDIINRQVKQMNSIVQSLLDAARAIGGKIQLQLEPADFGTIVRHAIETAQPLIESAGHEIELHLLDEPVYMILDSHRVEQIIVNLLTNALKYTEPGGHIILTVTHKEDDIILSVKDNGIGIPEEILPRIFNLFSQANQSLSNFKGGLGIGLMLAKTLAELHGGTLTASSKGSGRGSEFILQLPINKGTGDGKKTFENVDLKDLKLDKKRILVIDDNTALADVFTKLLCKLNQDAIAAYSGTMAIEAVHDRKPDIIFIDIAMPIMSGYELIKILRKDPGLKKTQFIALSGFGDEFSQKSKKAGFDDHLTKPPSIAQLVEILSKK